MMGCTFIVVVGLRDWRDRSVVSRELVRASFVGERGYECACVELTAMFVIAGG